MNYKVYILPLLFAMSMQSCDKRLDLLPQQQLADEIVFQNPTTAYGALIGVYSKTQNFDFYGSFPQIIGDFLGHNVNFLGTFPTIQDIQNFAAISTNANVQSLWRQHYEIIAGANKVIDNIHTTPTLTEAQANQYEGEARFLRALAYFQLSNLFSHPFQVSQGTNLAVPLVLEDFVGEISFPARSSLNAVHQQIIEDLTQAVALLPTSYSSEELTRGRATRGASLALLARIHLYRDELAQSIQAARDALAIGIYQLAPNFNFYNGNSAEDIFSIQNSAIDNGRTASGGWASYYNPAALGGRGDAVFSNELIAAFEEEPTDLRFTFRLEGIATDGLLHQFTTKYPDAATNSDNAPVLRTTELLLTLAEALAKSSTAVNGEALAILNEQIRQRANLPAKSISSSTELVEAILIERRKELAFEGHHRMDLLRNSQDLRSDNSNAAFGGNRTILPIPQRDIDVNEGLSGQQNPGY